MGFFEFLRHKGDGGRDLDATMAEIAREQARREDDARRRSALLRRDGRPLALERLETGVPGLPIADGDHLAKAVLSADVEAGTTHASRVDWYAWPEEAKVFAEQLHALERELSDALSGTRGAPRLRTDLSRVATQREGDEPTDGASVRLNVMPATKTGRVPKYPVEIMFTTMGGRSLTGSHGTVCYLKDGRPGKADVMYVGRSMSYEAAWRMSGKTLAPAWVHSYDLKTGAQLTVWRA